MIRPKIGLDTLVATVGSKVFVNFRVLFYALQLGYFQLLRLFPLTKMYRGSNNLIIMQNSNSHFAKFSRLKRLNTAKAKKAKAKKRKI